MTRKSDYFFAVYFGFADRDSMADILPAMVMERLSIALTRANSIY